jgi:hypothetical protein
MNHAPAAPTGRTLGVRSLLAGLSACLIALSTAMPACARGLDRVPKRDYDPVADPRAIVRVDNARFTILTSRLIRMEWSPDGTFEDRASLVFLNRRLPVPAFATAKEDGWTLIRTDHLNLRYRPDRGGFTAHNLRVDVAMPDGPVIWIPGTKPDGNLKGTIRTLDGVEGKTALEDGLLSRDGWTLVDDSRRPLFDDSEWPWVVARPETEGQDWYFFGYGRQYKDLLQDFTRVAGKIPMPPRFAFGAWWSRYWAYTDREFQQLVREFRMHDVPLDVLVIDMDWHQTFDMRWDKKVLDQAGERLGWTGYTWDSTYFPDPKGFLDWCGEDGLRTPLNLHPASGIQPHEVQYPAMARAMGIDPATRKYVPFNITDKRFAQNYLHHVIHPLEQQGVDFWWLDWQQWSTTTIPGVTPTWWLNYVFFTDMERRGTARPLLFHRWGGLGNHRYQIGFSGDAVSVWESLAFQPYFTATASNVGFGYWSHDIGGHMPGPVSAELYLRWIQFGVFSPILRTHTTKNPDAERRIWAYPHDEFLIMRDAFLLRYALIPYIYTASRHAYDSGVSICRPMYYDHPYEDDAYTARDQYMFGDAMLVAPVTTPCRDSGWLAETEIWFPEGRWIEWFTGSQLEGPARLKRALALDEIPVYVRAGSIVPMQPKMGHAGARPVDPLILVLFPGDSGSVRIYEDQGNSLDYQHGVCSWTTVRQKRLPNNELAVEILPVEGGFPDMLSKRSYEIILEGFLPPERVLFQGTQLPWSYDGDQLRVKIRVPEQPVRSEVRLRVTYRQESSVDDSLLLGFRGTLSGLRRIMPVLNSHWPREWSPPSLVHAAQTGTRMSRRPASAATELEAFRRELIRVRVDIAQMRIPEEDKQRVLWHLDRRP